MSETGFEETLNELDTITDLVDLSQAAKEASTAAGCKTPGTRRREQPGRFLPPEQQDLP